MERHTVGGNNIATLGLLGLASIPRAPPNSMLFDWRASPRTPEFNVENVWSWGRIHRGTKKKSNIEFGGAGVWSLASDIEFRGMGGFGHWHLEIAGTEAGTSRIRTGVAILFPPTAYKFREKGDKAYYKVSLDSIPFVFSYPQRTPHGYRRLMHGVQRYPFVFAAFQRRACSALLQICKAWPLGH